MAVDLDNFLDSLCVAIATATGLSYADLVGGKRQLWRHRAVETIAADPYTVVRMYGGPAMSWSAPQERSLQILTTASQEKAVQALAQNQAIFEALCDSELTPRRMWSLAAKSPATGHWLIHRVLFVQPPGVIGFDENGRPQAGFNVDVMFSKTA